METKKRAAEKAVEFVEANSIVGLGTGTTAYWAIQKIAERVKDGLQIGAVATSVASENLARELGIPILPFSSIDAIDITIDGADEVDKNKNLTKGGGGALLREKLIAFHTKKYLVIVDESKLVEHLGAFPLAVEILPFGAELTLKKLQQLAPKAGIRMREKKQFFTDNGNLIVDMPCNEIKDPEKFNDDLHQIPGVLETGLFSHTTVSAVIVGKNNGEVEIW